MLFRRPTWQRSMGPAAIRFDLRASRLREPKSWLVTVAMSWCAGLCTWSARSWRQINRLGCSPAVRQGTGGRWYRGSDRILGGVCSGLAAGLRIDPLWVRVAFVLLALVQGIGILIYVVLWFVIPESAGVQPIGRSRFD